MIFFNYLLFLTPIVCLVRIHWLSIILIIMFISLLPSLKLIIKKRYFVVKHERIKIEHPVPDILCFLIVILFAHQILSLIIFDFDIPAYFYKGLTKIVTEIVQTLIGISILYILQNSHKDYQQSLSFLIKGIIFAAIFFVFDHILDHKILSLLMPHLSSLNGYNISQSHQGQVFCSVIVWPLVGYLFILNKKKYAYWLIFCAGLIAFVAFVFHGLNYNAILSFLTGLFVFIFFIKYKKHFSELSIFAFLFLMLIVPILFTIFEQEHLSLLPKFKDSISHRFCIWHYYTQKIFDNILFGHGFNSAEKFGIIENVTCNMIQSFRHLNPALVANGHHPHNIGLQSVLELGLIGIIIIISIGVVIILKTNIHNAFIIRKQTIAMLNNKNTIHASFLASFFAFLVFLIAAVNIWSAWVIATIFYISIICKMVIHKK